MEKISLSRYTKSFRTAKSPRFGQRSNRGYMILVCVSLMGGIIFCGIAALAFYQLFESNSRLQSDADCFALTAAKKLNENNGVGKLNLLEQSSRELIYDARESFAYTNESADRDFEGVAQQLLSEARENRSILESTRAEWIHHKCDQLGEMAVQARQGQLFRAPFSFPWSHAQTPEIVKVEFGVLDKKQSSVEATDGLPQLLAFDTASGYLDERNVYYVGNQALSLPGADGGLKFRLACLSPVISGEIAGAHLAQAGSFKPDVAVIEHGGSRGRTPSDVPSAVRVQLSMATEAHLGRGVTNVHCVGAVAVTSGAEKPLE